MTTKIALAGNPNSGKTTLFNALTGSNQYVGNWPGVTVEKKEGRLKSDREVIVTDLPGIYSLSPYSLEEVIARNYLIDEQPDVILNIVDATNLERNLFLTTQLVEMGIPVVIALNMMDVVTRSGMTIDTELLSLRLGCPVVAISALRGEGLDELTTTALQAGGVDAAAALDMGQRDGSSVPNGTEEPSLCPTAARAVRAASRKVKAVNQQTTAISNQTRPYPQHVFSGSVEHALAHIEEALLHELPEQQQRFYAIKLFERDQKIAEKLQLTPEQVEHIEQDILRAEDELDDDSESIVTSERYAWIDPLIRELLPAKDGRPVTVSDKIDAIITNRVLALPIFALVMFVVYFVSVTTVGTLVTDWANDGVFGEGWQLFGIEIPGIPVVLESLLQSVNCADWLQGLILDGIVAGVGAVLGFVPQMLILFLFLAFLEGCGYMARVAFIMDRIFRRFGLSGKSFIPILIGTGCGVPGIMASRTIESDRDRKMTIMTTTFIPCSAKLPIIALITGAIFGGAAWVATSAYFIGMAAIICSGIILKKTRLFAGDVAPFVMELPAYHWPTFDNIIRSTAERGWSFVKKAGTIILLATVFVWSASNFGWAEGSFGMVEMPDSILARLGSAIAPIFSPLGWGDWKAAVAAITGLVAKENVVGTFGILYGYAEVSESGSEVWGQLAASFTMLSAYSFLLFNLLCAPCFAAMGAIKREMNNVRWFFFAIAYQCALAYAVALCVYQFGMLIGYGVFGAGTVVAFCFLAGFIYLLFRPNGGEKRAAGRLGMGGAVGSSGAKLKEGAGS